VRVLVFGAGVIGRIYAGRLIEAGHEVSLLCRTQTAADIEANGIMLRRNGRLAEVVHPRVLSHQSDAGSFDVALVAVRRDQVTDALPLLRHIQCETIVSLIDLPLGLDELSDALGRQRYVPAFPGVAGTIDRHGVVDYLEVRQQPTTIGWSPHAPVASALFSSAGFPTATTRDMAAWLKTHAVFISAFESSILHHNGDVVALARDAREMHDLVLAVREGLRTLQAIDVPVLPTAIRVIFLAMPIWFATRYWSRALAGPLGVLGMAPHSLASRETELPALQVDVRMMLKERPTPLLDAIFAGAVGRLPAKKRVA
jgi:2-dehydropantoate 2-reductase